MSREVPAVSIDDQLFFDPGHGDIREAARVIAESIGGRCLDNSTGIGVTARFRRHDGGVVVVVGPVWTNGPIEPEDAEDPTDREIFDSFPLLWSMRTSSRDGVPSDRAVYREVFDRLVSAHLGWPLVLAHNFGELIATYDAERGVRTFPPGTRSDGTGEHLWR